ncbi:STM3941 family protein [Flavobacterium sp. CAN_S2]|uniref:STM3941 family protein n=1 Tax=Flavobacterium sp. CAN_S2 TaxID=2787726 RepID=UPI0018C98127
MKEIKLYKSPFKSLRLLVLTSILVIPSIWLITKEKETDKIIWFCLCFFGFGFLLSLFNILDRRAQIIITKIGIRDITLRQGIIKWEYIEDANDVQIFKQVFVALKTNEKFVIKKKLYEWTKYLNNVVGGAEVNLNFSYIKVDMEKLITFINIMKSENIENRETIMEMYEDRIK